MLSIRGIPLDEIRGPCFFGMSIKLNLPSFAMRLNLMINIHSKIKQSQFTHLIKFTNAFRNLEEIYGKASSVMNLLNVQR